MFKNYFKIAFRNLIKNKLHSFINIIGLSVGMTVAMLTGLWIYDELSFNSIHKSNGRVAQVMQHVTFNSQRFSLIYNPYLMGEELRHNYGNYFKYVVSSTLTSVHILKYEEKKITKTGNFMDPDAPELLNLKMIKGTRGGLKDPSSVLLSESVATSIFGSTDPVDKIIRMDNKRDVKVTGVYADIPRNSDFREVLFIAPYDLYLSMEPSIKADESPWDHNNFAVFVQVADKVDMNELSSKIKGLRVANMRPEKVQLHHPEVFLHPMEKWHLYSEFKNGENIGGRIEFVWLFGIIGVFVLLLACINFMNLSTARSEKRAREIGIRKAIGSLRSQLINQFFSESLLVVAFAFLLSILLVLLILPGFNNVADKKMAILWASPLFWLLSIGFSFLTALIAGSYPAFYLSSFKPVQVLKGTFKAGRLAAVPRKVLIVLQFTVSIVLIIGTIVVFRQIQFAKNRPIGYNRNNLITVDMTPEISSHFTTFRDEIKRSGAALEVAASANPTTDYAITAASLNWKGKDPNVGIDFAFNNVSHEYGKTIGWEIKEGRDFSKDFLTDSSGFILNEAAVKFMGLKNPIGEIIQSKGMPYKVIGVIKDIVFESPYQPVSPSVYNMIPNMSYFVTTIKLNPAVSASKSLENIETIFNRYSPAIPFNFKFVDQEYAKKFGEEVRIGKLASFFTILAIIISCLGVFGMATFMAEQRVKEIAVRKTLGASVFSLWGLLSKDFIVMVIVSLIIAVPMAYYFMHTWLQNYQFRVSLSWWVFFSAGVSVLIITLLTVSYQTIKTALMNPTKSLRSE